MCRERVDMSDPTCSVVVEVMAEYSLSQKQLKMPEQKPCVQLVFCGFVPSRTSVFWFYPQEHSEPSRVEITKNRHAA